MSKLHEFSDLTEKWASIFNVKRGTKVKIISGFANEAEPHGINWNVKMKAFTGRVVEVIDVADGRVKVGIDGGKWVYPFTCLSVDYKLPIHVELNSDYIAVVTDVVKVGCQTLTLEHIERIEKAIESHESKQKAK